MENWTEYTPADCYFAEMWLRFTGSDVFFRNGNRYVVSPLVSETLNRPNKKYLRDRCALLVSSS